MEVRIRGVGRLREGAHIDDLGQESRSTSKAEAGER